MVIKIIVLVSAFKGNGKPSEKSNGVKIAMEV